MRPELPAEPWRSFLMDLDQQIEEVIDLHCMGGFAVVQAYGLARATADIDVLSAVPYGSGTRLIEIAGKQSLLRRKHGIYLDMVTVASFPENYQTRLIPLFPGQWDRLRLFALEAHDLALTKLERNIDRDRSDVEHLARSGYLRAATLRQRYIEEMQPYVVGRQSWHDQTLEMWIEAFFETES